MKAKAKRLTRRELAMDIEAVRENLAALEIPKRESINTKHWHEFNQDLYNLYCSMGWLL